MRQTPQAVKDRVIQLRKKYAEGYVSDYYMRTGKPQIVAEKEKAWRTDILPLMKEQKKQEKKAEKVALKEYKKAHKNSKEYRIVFK